jgi:membrane protein implicated in regulation of membrane protease activity
MGSPFVLFLAGLVAIAAGLALYGTSHVAGSVIALAGFAIVIAAAVRRAAIARANKEGPIPFDPGQYPGSRCAALWLLCTHKSGQRDELARPSC